MHEYETYLATESISPGLTAVESNYLVIYCTVYVKVLRFYAFHTCCWYAKKHDIIYIRYPISFQ